MTPTDKAFFFIFYATFVVIILVSGLVLSHLIPLWLWVVMLGAAIGLTAANATYTAAQFSELRVELKKKGVELRDILGEDNS